MNSSSLHKASQLHQQIRVFLTHDHTMYSLAERRSQGERGVFSRTFAPRFRQGGVNGVGWVVGGDPRFFGIDDDHPWWGSLKLLDMLWQEAQESQDTLQICLNTADLEDALTGGKVAVIMTMEGGKALCAGSDPLVNLRVLHRLGLRSLQLLAQGWTELVNAGDGAWPDPSRGWSEIGKDVILEMNRLGMVIDMAHVPDPDPLFWDVIELSQQPIIDSHRCTQGANDVYWNISDERIQAIARSSGVVGLQFFSDSLRGNESRPATVDDLVRHIDHIVEIAGVDAVALGPDFLEPELIGWEPGHFAEGLEDISTLPRVTEALLGHGYSDVDIHKIMGDNILRVYKDVIG